MLVITNNTKVPASEKESLLKRLHTGLGFPVLPKTHYRNIKIYKTLVKVFMVIASLMPYDFI